jgi:hypothetical protein
MMKGIATVRFQPGTFTPHELVKGYENLFACRAAAIIRELGGAVVSRDAVRELWVRRYPCRCTCRDLVAACTIDLQIVESLAVLRTLGAARIEGDRVVTVDAEALGHLADNLAIIERHRRPLPRAQWGALPYVPRVLRPLQAALVSAHAPNFTSQRLLVRTPRSTSAVSKV